MKSLTDEIKKQIEVQVHLDYDYRMEAEFIAKLECIAKVLKKYNLKPKISDGYHWGPCKNLHCEGIINLYEADLIEQELHTISASGRVEYYNGKFGLGSPNLYD